MGIYTRTGDSGETLLFGGGRVPKSHPRVAAYGTVDELNSVLGWALTRIGDASVRERLRSVQHDLFAIGAELATPPARAGRTRPDVPGVPVGRVSQMETWMDEAEEELGALTAFILPGGSEGAASLHIARTVCRRAEREVVALDENGEEPVDPRILTYLNRLSDLLFTFARIENRRSGVEDTVWRKPGASRSTTEPAPKPGAP